MLRSFSPRAAITASFFLLVAIAMRVWNALRYPPDWGFDASFNWRYIYRLSQDWFLPPAEAGWSTSDPPLFFALAAACFDLLRPLSEPLALASVPLLNTGLGLMLAWLAFDLARRAEPPRPERALLAAGLVLYLPAHVQMSAMVNEEMLAALLGAAVVYGLARRGFEGRGAPGAREAVPFGVASGLALLTKLSGALAGATAAAVCVVDGLRGNGRRALGGAVVIGALSLLLGGWFYLRGSLFGAYLDPRGLEIHAPMRAMPPGERSLFDYAYVPLATFTDPQLLHPDLLRSVWGGTYVGWWFDGHRHLLPLDDPGVSRLGTVTLLLALLPTLACGIGFGRGARRALREPAGGDLPLLASCVLTLAAYAVYTWSNPYFAVVKGTALLALALPFSFYASEVLAGWARGPGLRANLVRGALAALALAVVLGSSFDLAFSRGEAPGLPWRSEAPLPSGSDASNSPL